MHACFRAARLPADCSTYAPSLAKAAELILRLDGLAPLVPAADAMIRACPAAASSAPAPPAAVPTVLDELLADERSTMGGSGGGVTRADLYMSGLCPVALGLALEDVRTGELLLCSSFAVPRRVLRGDRETLRRRLGLPPTVWRLEPPSSPPPPGRIPQFGEPRNLAWTALRDIVLLDHAFERCGGLGGEWNDGGALFGAMRGCFAAAALPADCAAYRPSLLKAAELVASRETLDPLLPVTVMALQQCPREAGAAPQPERRRTVSELSVLDWLLRREGEPDPPSDSHRLFLPHGQLYLSSLCGDVTEGWIAYSAAEMLLCADRFEPETGAPVHPSRAGVRRMLEEERRPTS